MYILDSEKTKQIYEILRKKYPAPAYAYLENVRNQTGYSSRDGIRTADAMVMSLWPSRGLTLTGFEIKASRTDWLKEYSMPWKAEAIQKYCDYWYLITFDDKIVQPGELPETWGHIILNNKKLIYVKEAPLLKPEAMSRNILGSILRNVTENFFTKEQLNKRIESAESIAKSNIDYNLKNLEKNVEDFENASGVKIKDEWRIGQIGEVVKMVIESRHLDVKNQLIRFRDYTQNILNDIDKALIEESIK